MRRRETLTNQSRGGAVIGMHLCRMRYVDQLRAPRFDQGLQTTDQVAIHPQMSIRLPPEFDATESENFSGRAGFLFANLRGDVGRGSMTAVLARGEKKQA